jgi:DNA-binding transcriptional MerR regulator
VSSVAYAYSPKSAEAFRTISEVADELDVPQHVLRFWESRFAQIRPVKRAGGRRYYRPEDVDLIKGIQALLHGEGFTIKGVQKVLKERGARHVAEVGRKGVIAPSEPVVIEKIVYVH